MRRSGYIFLAVCLVLVLVLWGCSRRKRSNPLDPLNPETGGRVQGVTVVSERHTVYVDWYPVFMDAVSSYRVYRKTGNLENVTLMAEVSSSRHEFEHSGAEYEKTYSYTVTAVAGDYESPGSDPVSITPGPLCFWVADRYGGVVARLSYDIGHWFFRSLFLPSPVDVAADTAGSSAWIIDRTGYVSKFTVRGEMVLQKSALYLPLSLSYDHKNSRMWIVQDDGRMLTCFDTLVTPVKTYGDFSGIAAAAWSAEPAGCWVVDSAMHAIYFATETEKQQADLPVHIDRPVSADLYRAENVLYVADAGDVVRIDLKDRTWLRVQAPGKISQMVCDQNTGDCWVYTPSTGEITRIAPDGRITARFGGFEKVNSMVCDPSAQGVVVADYARSKIIHMSGDGSVLNESEHFSGPWALAAE